VRGRGTNGQGMENGGRPAGYSLRLQASLVDHVIIRSWLILASASTCISRFSPSRHCAIAGEARCDYRVRSRLDISHIQSINQYSSQYLVVKSQIIATAFSARWPAWPAWLACHQLQDGPRDWPRLGQAVACWQGPLSSPAVSLARLRSSLRWHPALICLEPPSRVVLAPLS
jgi:hypothetical protein